MVMFGRCSDALEQWSRRQRCRIDGERETALALLAGGER
jgi:hypothetical protein